MKIGCSPYYINIFKYVFCNCFVKFLEAFDGTKVYYKIKKQSDLFLIFVHGWANNWTAWKKEIGFFQKKGFSTLALDLRGHGQSGKPDNKAQYHLKSFAKDINEIVKKEKIKDSVLIGHSMGGMIALTYYKLFNKKIKALVLCDTTYENVLEHRKVRVLSPFVKHVLDFIISHEGINKKHFSHLKDLDLTKYENSSDYFIFYKGLHNTPMKSVFACLESMMRYNVKSILSKIKIPVLILEGANDKLLPEIDSFEMYEEIRGAEIDFIPKGRHCVNLESPELVDRYILHFLRKHLLLAGVK